MLAHFEFQIIALYCYLFHLRPTLLGSRVGLILASIENALATYNLYSEQLPACPPHERPMRSRKHTNSSQTEIVSTMNPTMKPKRPQEAKETTCDQSNILICVVEKFEGYSGLIINGLYF